MSASLPVWAMEQNVILQAGAGTGKTHALVTLALHLLSGANAKRTPIPPVRLVALTFTEKAGAELRERLHRRLTPLANGVALATAEPELAATFEALGLAHPSPELWQRVRRDLALATIGTFHSFCAFQLRRLAPLVGLDPSFEVLDDDDARALFEDATEGYLLSALASGNGGVRGLVDEFGLTSDRPLGLVELTRSVLLRLEEDGRAPRTLDDGRFAEALAARQLQDAMTRLREAVSGFPAPTGRTSAKFAALIRSFQTIAARMTPASVEREIERLAALRRQLTKPRGDAGANLTRFDEALQTLGNAAAGVRAAPLGRAFVDVLDAVERRYTEVKRSRNAVDFADLQRILRNALRDDLGARRDLKGRIDALLVDEFQDTSRLQLDLVSLLAESRAAEAELKSADLAAEVVWEPGFLCAVGDRKQSIYEFRGADVAVFAHLQEQLSKATPPVRIEYLQRSYRSRPRLVSLVNTLFRQVMPGGGLSFEVSFSEGDALTPMLDEEVTAPLARIIQAVGARAEQHRPDEAKRLAAHLDAILNDPKERLEVRDRASSDLEWRKAEGCDIVMLFRRLTNVNLYRNALAERGIPHVLVGGGGFYATQEVLDAWALLRSIDDPTDAVASNALLRSPWCTLSDETISRLALTQNGAITAIRGVSLERLLQHRPRLQDAGEQARLDALLDFVEPMRRGLDQIGTAQLLALAIEELDYFAVVAVQPDAESVAANLEKLLRILTRLESRHVTPRGVIRTVTERIWAGYRESEAASTEEADPRCVRLMTIHQAKGLEFPVVVVPDCGAWEPPENSRIAYDRDLGLGLNVRMENEQLVDAPGLADIRGRLTARRRAESLRLLYVALTRARDHLIVSGVPGRNSWFELLAALGDEHLRTVDVDPTLPARAPSKEAELTTPTTVDWRAPAELHIDRLTVPVASLSEFQTCPERYRLRQLVKLQEHEGDLIGARTTPASEAMKGTHFADEAARVPAQRQFRELPFSLCTELPGGQQVIIEGQIDWAVLKPHAAQLVQLRHPSARVSPLPLMTSALALRDLLGGTLPVEAAVISGAETEPQFERVENRALDEHRTSLQQLGEELIASHATNTWSRRERAFCDELKCGYRARCFGRGAK